jgi:hypothetical protein
VSKPVKKEGLAARSLRAQLLKQGRGPTLMEHAVIKAGLVQGAEALWNLAMWTMARRKHGREPNVKEFGEIACLQQSMAYRAMGQLQTVYGDHLVEAADALEAATGKQLDALLAVQGGKDLVVLAGIAGPVVAPVGLAL